MEEIEKVFEKLPSPKTPGPDGVSGEFFNFQEKDNYDKI